jgi:hypothetical protein
MIVWRTHSLTKTEEGLLNAVEMMRIIFGPVKDGEVRQLRYNRELCELFGALVFNLFCSRIPRYNFS